MRYLWVIGLFFLAACGSGNKGGQTSGLFSGAKEETSLVTDSNWYKRFTGTVAGQAVVANLMNVEGRISGTYYYQSQGKLIGIAFTPDSAKKNVYHVEEMAERSDGVNSKWLVTLNGNTIAGKWQDDAGNNVYDISLKQDDNELLKVYLANDSIPYKPGQAKPAAEIENSLLVPGAAMSQENAAFINKLILHNMGCDSLHQTTIEGCLKAQLADYTKFYRDAVGSMDDTLRSENFNNYYTSLQMQVAYNDNGWLALEFVNSDYTGGAHGNYGSLYVNADLRNNNVWELKDVLRVDSVKLSRLLDKEARRRNSMDESEPINKQYFADRIPATNNFYLTHKGITFNYVPYEIASYADGEIQFFIPYTAIKDLLTPAFAQRMGIR